MTKNAMTIPALPTAYAGRIFGSRYKARWAMFMDLMGVEYAYRFDADYPEVGDGWRPDFYLPSLMGYLQVMPCEMSLTDKQRVDHFVRRVPITLSDCPTNMWVISGRIGVMSRFDWNNVGGPLPYRGASWFWFNDEFDDECRFDDVSSLGPTIWSQCPFCGWVGLCFEGEVTDTGLHRLRCKQSQGAGIVVSVDTPQLRQAYQTAAAAKMDSWANLRLSPAGVQ